MARVLLILSIVIGLGSAFLGYKTKLQADELQGNLKKTKSALAEAQSKQKKAETDLVDAKKELDSAHAALKKADEDVTNAKAQATAAQADLRTAQADLDGKTKQLANVEATITQLQEKIKGINLETLPETLKNMTEEKTRMETELAEAKQVLETAKTRADEAVATAQTKERVIQEYKQGFVRSGLTGKVVAYNPGWNFVVLNIGDKAGLKSGVQLVILRDGSMVGKVKVTSVEPATSIADVLPGTVARGDSVQPGDKVVFEGRR